MKNLSLRTKLFLIIGLFGLLPYTITAWLGFRSAEHGLILKTSESLQAQGLTLMERIDAVLFERYGDVQVFAADPRAGGEKADVTAEMNSHMQVYGLYDLMLVADLDGKVVAANRLTRRARRWTRRSWWARTCRVRLGSRPYAADACRAASPSAVICRRIRSCSASRVGRAIA